MLITLISFIVILFMISKKESLSSLSIIVSNSYISTINSLISILSIKVVWKTLYY